MRRRNKAQKDILYITVSSFVLVVIWVSLNIYHASVTSTIDKDLQVQILPIAPSFDTATINRLKNRENLDPIYTIDASSEASVTLPPMPSVFQQNNQIENETPVSTEEGALEL